MSGYLEYKATSARNESLLHYAALQRRARERSGARQARGRRQRTLPTALLRRSGIA